MDELGVFHPILRNALCQREFNPGFADWLLLG